ncbi:PREDICTED: protein NLRC5 [Thamnophis sirtalis]|uniref:Protein NLRC5 n=1 Tax=Thamnophis sirtalis TaxID=35019 RepID=A0A6I9XZ59_9SAUR|nr:PREDICTED: protein NLRC5 [Thamnophis sirtalis]
MTMDGAQRQSIIRRIWPQLIDFLSDRSEWVLDKAERLLSQGELRLVHTEPDLKKKRLLVLDMVLRDVDANPEVFRTFIQSVCMECSPPFELEITLLSISEEDAPESYSQCILRLMRRKYGISHSAEAAKTKDQFSSFSQRFVNLVIHQSKTSKLKVGKEKMKEEPMAAYESKDHDIPMMNLSDLFKSAQMGITQVVLLLGKAGVGKSWLVHKICQQWAEEAFPQFKWIFFFEFKQLNLIKRKLTLQELLFDYFLQPEQPEMVFQFLLKNAHQTLVILDSLDEFMDNIDLPPISFDHYSNLLIPRSVSELVANLCHGKLLPGCTVLITSRPKQLPTLLVRSTVLSVEIWGFNHDKVAEYVSCFFQQAFQKEQALALLNENGKLLSMCYIPVLCHIICICLEHLFLEDSESVQLPQTRTQFYLRMLQTFLCKHQGGRTLNEVDMAQHQTILGDLCELAFKGLEEKKGVFDAGEVPEHVKDFSCRFGLLLTSEMKMGKDSTQAGYTFAHFSLQEFLAALFLLTSPTVDGKMLKENFFLRTKWTLKKETRMPFTENNYVFLSGLLSQECRQFLCSLAGRNEVRIQERQSIIRKILQKLAVANLTGPRIVELSHCVYETQDICLAHHIATKLSFTFRNVKLMPFDMVTLAFLINGGSHGVCLDFDGCFMELDYLDIWGSCEPIKSLSFKNRQYGSEFAGALSKTLPKIKLLTTFQLTGGNLKRPGFEDLVRVLPNCHQLEIINLQDNRLEEQDMIKLAEIFPAMGKLKRMEKTGSLFMLEQKFPPQVGKGAFAVHRTSHPLLPDAEGPTSFDALVHFPALQKLWLTNDRIPPTSIEYIAKILQRGFAIEDINFSNSDLSLDNLSILLDSLEGKYHLKSINFGSLNLDNATILKLFSRLSTMPLLKILGLNNNHLDSRMCSHLAEVLKTTLQIEEIDLSHNKIDDAGMKAIAMALPGMKNVKLINFSCNSITSAGGQWIVEGLIESERLEILKLSGNSIGNKTLGKLAPILPYKKHLKVLHLSRCQLGSEGLGHLAGILAKCPQMEEINLSENNIGDKGVMSLMTPWPQSSQLRKIDLKACHIRDCASKTLIVGLSCCPSLEEIGLSWNELGDETAKELAMVLPGMIRVKILDLDKNSITVYGASMLARQLFRCPGIQTIRLWNNSIPRDLEQQLANQEPRLHFALL